MVKLIVQWMVIFGLMVATIVATPFVAVYLGISHLLGWDNNIIDV